MKKCPACEAVFEDSTLVFCTNCGANLVDNGITEPNPQPTPPPVAPQYNYNHNNQYNTPPCKYCTHCGNPCDPKAVICVKCGAPFGNTYSREDDKPSKGLKFLSFIIPLLGLILYLVNMNEKPISAKAYGKSALIGFIVGIVLYVLYFILLFLLPLFVFGFDSGVTYYDSEILYSGFCSLF